MALELYKIAAARLSFQDDYLFKFTAVFLAAHGALVAMAQTAIFGQSGFNPLLLKTASVIGLLLALLWAAWIYHNDYWHSVWVGALKNIETRHLGTSVRVFAAEHEELAAMGGRKKWFFSRGHGIAISLALGVAGVWTIGLYIATCTQAT